MNCFSDKQILDAITSDMDDIIYIDNASDTYTVEKSDSKLKDILKEEGTTDYLFKALFFSKHEHYGEVIEGYYSFFDKSVFLRDKHKGTLAIHTRDDSFDYFFNILRINETQSILMLSSAESIAAEEKDGIEQLDTIKESYLFTMTIDLKKQVCINSYMPEFGLDERDFSVIPFPEWRKTISGMFSETDRLLFFRMTEPENIINTLEEKAEYHMDVQMKNLSGAWRWVRLSMRRVKNFSRENPKVVYTVTDLTEDMAQLLKQENIVKAVEEKNQKLVESDKKRMMFFSSLSHEIRTPINSILGMIEVIIRESSEENIRSYASDINDAGKILLSLVNDILDYSKIEAGKMDILPVEYNIEKLVASVSRLITPRTQEKALEFETIVDDDVPRVLFGDEIRISQILINLLSNSVKYTDKGKVTLRVKKGFSGSNKTGILFEVIDTGIGITEEEKEKLFDEFTRFDLEHNRNVEGTGLGLAIVKGLVNQMSGRINVTSAPGEGSTFAVMIPQKVVDEKGNDTGSVSSKTSTRERKNYSDKKILVVDDTKMNLKVFSALIAPYKAQVTCVESGQEAIEAVQKAKFDLIFLDHMMPQMDGIETLGHLRKIEGYEDTTIVSLTGNYSPTAKVEYQSMGFTDYLQKPVLPDVLNELLNTYLN